MNNCFWLFALHTMDNDARTLTTSNAVTSQSLDAIPDMIPELMTRIRPHAIKLDDSRTVPDYLLQCALRTYDGKIYKELFDMAHDAFAG
jgi:acyl-CoA oxidase